jgi:hypothetical protein
MLQYDAAFSLKKVVSSRLYDAFLNGGTYIEVTPLISERDVSQSAHVHPGTRYGEGGSLIEHHLMVTAIILRQTQGQNRNMAAIKSLRAITKIADRANLQQNQARSYPAATLL